MTAKDRLRKATEKLDKVAETTMSPDVTYGQKPGYIEEDVEQRAQETAAEEGFTLRRNPDGSHEAVDESKVDEETDNES